MATQSALQETVSPVDNSVFTPKSTSALGQKDAVAVNELTAYASALGGGGHWSGMQGTGTITYARDPTQYSVTITNQGSIRFRLDTQTPAGVQSIRIQGRMGKVKVGDKPVLDIDPDTAILGIFPFQIAERTAQEPKNTALLDHGSVSSDGRSLHRVTLELLSVGWNPVTNSLGTLPVDLYFDPTTHLLVKSACYVFIPGGRPVPLLSVVTYDDYRQVGTAMVPFHFSEKLNGQPYRAVQLSSIQLKPILSADYFKF